MKAFYILVDFHGIDDHYTRMLVVAENKQQAFDEVRLCVANGKEIDTMKVSEEFSLDSLPVILETHLAPHHEGSHFKFTGLQAFNHNGRLLKDEYARKTEAL